MLQRCVVAALSDVKTYWKWHRHNSYVIFFSRWALTTALVQDKRNEKPCSFITLIVILIVACPIWIMVLKFYSDKHAFWKEAYSNKYSFQDLSNIFSSHLLFNGAWIGC